MYCYSKCLKVVDNTLYGREHFWSDWVKISPEDIVQAKEFGPIDPYIRVWTYKGTFFVGALRRQYGPVTMFLKEHTEFDLAGTIKHDLNKTLFQKK